MRLLRNRTENKRYVKRRPVKAWRKLISAALCLCMLCSLSDGLNGLGQMETLAASEDDAAYEQEQKERSDEYAKKFDLENLKWKTDSARTYLYWRPGQFGGVNYRNYIHVYAFEGETICFGSNVCNSILNEAGTRVANAAEQADIVKQLGEGATVDIVLTDLKGNRIPYDVNPTTGAGYIPNVQTEVLAKTMESPAGNAQTVGTDNYSYTPLTYQVRETGVYTFEFHSYNYNNSTTGQTVKNTPTFYSEGTDTAHGSLVAAWDVSVFNERKQKETGRVYADYLSLQQNGGAGKVMETYYVVTTDSYIYRWEWKGNQPYTYNFFADNRGLTDNATGSTLYKSVKDLSNTSGFDYTKFGASYKYPGSVNTDLAKSYYLFFEMPDADLEGHLYSKAIQPDPAENIRFMDRITVDGVEVPGAYEGMGGYFAFETKEATTATLVLDFTRLTDEKGTPIVDTEGKQFAPVTISGPVKPYDTNYFYWDGRDGNGKVIPPGKYDIRDILTLTTKAGEIHFPIHDMEQASGGFTFTRVSPIYDHEGNRVDKSGTILDATKSVIYYDDSALYYGEHVGRTGLTEDLVQTDISGEKLRDKFATRVEKDGDGNTFFRYNNMLATGTKGREYDIRTAVKDYVNGVDNDKIDSSKPFIRIGDHSHVTNQIEYYGSDGKFLTSYGDQSQKIAYLDSAAHPVGISNSGSGASTTDYGITDYWTFIPAQPAKIDAKSEMIDIIGGTAFNLTGQVFFDSNQNGTYNSMADGDTLLSGISLRLYRKTTDVNRIEGKEYYLAGSASNRVNSADKIDLPRTTVELYNGPTPAAAGAFELFRTSVTAGRYFFTNIPYAEGDTFLYEVVRPNSSYRLTSGQTKPGAKEVNGAYNGSYALYAFDSNGRGSEVQSITVGNAANQVDPEKNLMGEANHTVTAVDVGYYFDTYTKLTMQKNWKTDTGTVPDQIPVFELCYVNAAGAWVYDERPLAQIEKLTYSYELLPNAVDGQLVRDWYVSAEYYINGNTLYKHRFAYNQATGIYEEFVGDSVSLSLTDNGDGVYNQFDVGDWNGDGTSNWSDLAYIPEENWTAGGAAPYHAVLDRNPGSAEITISITNAEDPGVIEIQKYTGALEDGNFLSGATFRLYTDIAADGGKALTIEDVQAQIDKGEDGLGWLADRQIGSATTRDNGRVAFPGLDTNKHYVLREVFAPAGYRIMEALYLIHPAGCVDYHTEQPGGMEGTAWEKWQQQNFQFEADGYVMTDIANIPANGDMAIRKQIDGRAWNINDAFIFDLSFWNPDQTAELTYAADTYNYPGAIEIDDAEYAIVTADGGSSAFQESMKTFIDAFNKSDGKDIIVNNNSVFAKNVISVNGSQDVEVALSDTKQSVSLIVNDDPELNEKGEPVNPADEPDDAQLNTSGNGGSDPKDTDVQAPVSHTFPAAGTYTFTIRENAANKEENMTYTDRVYTLIVDVTRSPNPGIEEGTTLSKNNSYLHADVQQIYYQEPEGSGTADSYPAGYGGRNVYAGVAPTFTNSYHIQPAVQYTSYAIEKVFSGRLDENGDPVNKGTDTENWLADDRFTVTITGADETTQDALNNGNIYIGGLHGKIADPDMRKAIRFEQTQVVNANHTDDSYTGDVVDEGHIFNFEELDFRNLSFPVEWVFSDPYKLPDGKKMGDTIPTDADKLKDVVIYLDTDNIYSLPPGNYFAADLEHMAEGNLYPVTARTQDIVYTLLVQEVNSRRGGITYDDRQFKMVITLKNAVNPDPASPGAAVTDGIVDEMDIDLFDSKSETPEKSVATCRTNQHVVTDYASFTNPEDVFTDDDTEPGGIYYQYYVNAEGVIRPVEETGGQYFVEIDGDQYEITDANFNEYEARNVTFIVKYEYHTGEHRMQIHNTYADETKWIPKVTKTMKGRDWATDEAFTFRIEAETWPGSDSGTSAVRNQYKPEIASGPEGMAGAVKIAPAGGKEDVTYEANLPEVTFHRPGTYTFSVREDAGAGVGHGSQTYSSATLKVVATSNTNGQLDLAVSATVDDSPPADSGFLKVDGNNVTLNFVNVYDEYGDFPLKLSKLLTGRKWTDETFTFFIEPVDAAKEDIDNGILIPPTAWGSAADGKYKVTVGSDPSPVPNEVGWQMQEISLGELQVKNLKAKGQTYKFNITEDTTGFNEANLSCAQPAMQLQIQVTSEWGTEGGYTGDLEFDASYAYLSGGKPGESITPAGDTVILPFVNTDTRLGSVTVEKQIKNDLPSDTDAFSFTVTLKPPADPTLPLSSKALKVTDAGGEELKAEWETAADKSLTWTFTLKHGEKISIGNVPYGTAYTVTEGKAVGYHLQEVTGEGEPGETIGTDASANPRFDPDKGTADGTLDAAHTRAYLRFINARAFAVPYTGGAGWRWWTLFGLTLVLAASMTYLFYRRRRKST